MSFETTPFKTLFKVPQKNGLNKPSRVRGAGLPMVNMGEIFAYRRIADIEMDLVPTTEKEMGALLEYGDLLFARQSLVYEGSGKCAIFVGHQKTVFESHLIRVRLNSNVSDPRYFFYLFNSSVGRELMAGIISQGAGASGIKGSDLIELEVPKPPLRIQRQIADFLDSLEIQIEVLKQQNTVLESIAQTIFKSWFVNFDPVHAKAAGREPEGLSAEIAALFPNEFMESEIGLIPKGWVISSLGSLAELVNGFAFKSKDWQQDGNRVVKIGNVTPLLVNLDGCSYVSETTALGLDKFQARAGEILVGMTGYVGEAGLVPIHQGKVFVNQRVCKLVPRNPTWRSAVFAISRIPEFKKFCESNASGSAQANISGGQILGFPVVLPSNSSILEALNRAVEPLIETIVNNSGLIANLSDLRDELLPRLISGKIRIEGAEEALADVMPLTEKQVA